ncbi:ABC transporter permease [Pseudobacteriovorax antillogorgiicola]|uniref:Transport permease protein n=1 Tax=Pseudobacteriovorax antillogorgiicola TaxID=1513793 RepID=A0A1Y6C6L8_9BACT|nr:ABC transporter permease [Pseudobacteriovorax antillogorgiicola]TCS50636.1 capsular polysaccharide transport system permease protein [Pseudobacteriovorax antillogorgiicola]SMF39526.1 capsular polysaccharide transport system permease protein [Pseudobacteriovorax antillogorgiicola]
MKNATIKSRNSLEIFRDVVLALFLREVKTRFGKFRLGWAWALIEPLTHVAIFSLMWGLRGTWEILGHSAPLFIFLGIMPYNLFSNNMTRSMNAASANRGLFNFQQVRPIHTLISRWLLELFIFVMVCAVFILILWWFQVDVAVHDPGLVLEALFFLVILSIGAGLCTSGLVTMFPEMEKVVPMLTRPLYFLSGIFYAAATLPSAAVKALAWNPIFCAIELIREGYLGLPLSPYISETYLVKVALITLLVGLYLHKRTWIRMVAT